MTASLLLAKYSQALYFHQAHHILHFSSPPLDKDSIHFNSFTTPFNLLKLYSASPAPSHIYVSKVLRYYHIRSIKNKLLWKVSDVVLGEWLMHQDSSKSKNNEIEKSLTVGKWWHKRRWNFPTINLHGTWFEDGEV